MPTGDLIKLLTANITAAFMAIGGVALIVVLFLNTPVDRLGELAGILALLGGFVGAATTYLWQSNTIAATRGQTRNDLLEPPPGG
jgi:hypothetical protein